MPGSPIALTILLTATFLKILNALWGDIDIAIVGIGNNKIIQNFGRIFGYNEKHLSAVGDIATHFFNQDGSFVELYENTLSASKDNLKNAKETVAVACGQDKTSAIAGALRTGLINTLITDEYTARRILSY